MGVVVGGGGGVLLRVCLWLISIVVVVLLMRLSTVAVQGGRGIWVISFILKRVAVIRNYFKSENLLGGLKKHHKVDTTALPPSIEVVLHYRVAHLLRERNMLTSNSKFCWWPGSEDKLTASNFVSTYFFPEADGPPCSKGGCVNLHRARK